MPAFGAGLPASVPEGLFRRQVTGQPDQDQAKDDQQSYHRRNRSRQRPRRGAGQRAGFVRRLAEPQLVIEQVSRRREGFRGEQ